MRRIRLVLAALAVVVAALAALAGPAMAQTYSYDQNWGNQQGYVIGPGGYVEGYDNGWTYDPYYGYYYPGWGYSSDWDPYDYPGLYISEDGDGDGYADNVLYWY
jgi:hypothetical protein